MWKSCVWASYPSKNTPQLMPMSGPFSSMWEKELKMSSLNEGYPLPQCFHFGIVNPDHDVSESEAEGWWKRVQLSHRLGPAVFQFLGQHVFLHQNHMAIMEVADTPLVPAWGCPKKSSPRAPRGSWTTPKSPGPGAGVSSPENIEFTMKNGFQHFW